MRKDSIIDYFSCILLKIFGPTIRSFPPDKALFLGRRLGDLFYYFAAKHKAIVHSNIKAAFGRQLPPSELRNLAKKFYRNFGQNIIEIFFIPLVDKKYMNKYISFEGLDYIAEGFNKSKGVILLAVHEGSWELSNIICANLGFPFNLFIREQRYPRLNALLNSYRTQKGCKLIQRQNQMRHLIKALINNEAIGMTVDQGGRSGTLVEFLGKRASMASGAVRIALKYDAALIPAFYTRINGPYIKVILGPPVKVNRTLDKELDIRNNLQEVIRIFEKHIVKYPQEYLWSYKIWKYSQQKDILILSDGKAGHLRQSEAVAQIIKDYLQDKGITSNIVIKEGKFKNKFSQYALTLSSCCARKYSCQGCLWCLKIFLQGDSYKDLISLKSDIVVSCGSSMAPINLVLARENLAKSVVIMRPSVLSTARFDLVVMSRHDQPPQRKNVLAIEGALNLINDEYLDNCKSQIVSRLQRNGKELAINDKQLIIGLLIGGNTKDFHLEDGAVSEVINQLKFVSIRWDSDILVTTSRRTPLSVEKLVQEEFKDSPHCKLLVVANENNIPEAVGGILALSKIIIISSESISMISEAVNSKKYVLVFNSSGVKGRHKRFLEHFIKNKYISLIEPGDLAKKIEDIWLNKPGIHTLRDNVLVSEAVKKII